MDFLILFHHIRQHVKLNIVLVAGRRLIINQRQQFIYSLQCDSVCRLILYMCHIFEV